MKKDSHPLPDLLLLPTCGSKGQHCHVVALQELAQERLNGARRNVAVGRLKA